MSIPKVVDLEQHSMEKVFGKNDGYWEYRTVDDQSLCFTVRKNRKDGGKTVTPWRIIDGEWVNRGFSPEDHVPFYNAHLLSKYPNKPILIVEGEKTACMGANLYPEFNVITWLGGCDRVKKINPKLLTDKVVYILPDNDEPGFKAARKLQELLHSVVKKLFYVDVSTFNVPEKWDLADIGSEFGDIDSDLVLELIKDSNEITTKFIPISKEKFPDLSFKGNALNTTDNIAFMLDFYKIKISYNLMTKYPEFHCPGKSFSKVNEADCYFTEISNLCVKNAVPKVDLDAHINLISERNMHHPAIDFILSKPWDGHSRIDEFMQTIECDNENLSKKLLYRWMLGAVAAPFCYEGISMEGILVFQGKQSIGKTYWFLKLVPESHRFLVQDGILLDPNNKDSVIGATSCWLGELGEIDGTIRKSDIAAQKAFITRSKDTYRVPFGRKERKVPRQTVFYGSVNTVQYLIDETGNRRYWSISIKQINYDHQINMQQVWAEFKVLLDKGESYRLTAEEKLLLNEENKSFEFIDPLEEAILNRFYWDEPYRNNSMTASALMMQLGFVITDGRISQSTKKCAGILSKLTGKKARKSDGQRVYDLPRQR